MLSTAYRITRVQKTLRWFEEDMPLLNMRVKDLSAEHQRSARQFAAAVRKPRPAPNSDRTASRIQALRAGYEAGERSPCEPAD